MEPLFVIVLIVALIFLILNLKKKIKTFITIFMLFSMFLGVFTASFTINKNDSIIDRFNYEKVRIKGEITSVPTNNNTFFLKVGSISSSKGTFKESFNIFVSEKVPFELKIGDRLDLNCTLYESELINAELSNFYLAKGTPLIAKDITIIEVDASKEGLVTKLRNYIINIGNKFFSKDVKAMFCALTAGDRTDFSESLNDNLRKSGLSHIACVSGLHVSILGMAIFNLLIKKNRALAASLSIFMVYIFALVTGATPSTMRAAIMFTCFIVAKITLFENHSFTALSVSAVMLIFFNPFVLFDWGFILSYLSVFGIEVFCSFIRKLLGFLPNVLRDSIAITISAQLMTLPAITNMFGYLPVYSIVANILISAVFVYVLYLCFVFVPIALIPGVNDFVAMFVKLSIELVLATAEFFAELPFSTTGIDKFDVYEIIFFYILVLMFIFRDKLSIYFMGTVILICSLVILITGQFTDDGMEKYALNDGSKLYLCEDYNVLEADGGIIETAEALKRWRSIDKIDYLVVRNMVENQENGLIELNNYGDVGVIYIPEEYKNTTFQNIAYKIGVKCEYYTEDCEEVVKKLTESKRAED